MNSEFIILVRKTSFEPFPVTEGTIKELQVLQVKLLKQVEETILINRETGKVYLEQNYKEVFIEYRYVKTKVLKWLNEQREMGFDEYNRGFSNTKELLNSVADTLQYLKEFARNYFPIEPLPVIKNKFTVNQIALIHVYEKQAITRKNADEIAASYGNKSGEKLFQTFTKYSSRANRIGKPMPCTPKTFNNKKELFESIIKHLTDKAKQWANDEIKMLTNAYKTYIENEY